MNKKYKYMLCTTILLVVVAFFYFKFFYQTNKPYCYNLYDYQTATDIKNLTLTQEKDTSVNALQWKITATLVTDESNNKNEEADDVLGCKTDDDKSNKQNPKYNDPKQCQACINREFKNPEIFANITDESIVQYKDNKFIPKKKGTTMATMMIVARKKMIINVDHHQEYRKRFKSLSNKWNLFQKLYFLCSSQKAHVSAYYPCPSVNNKQ